tara:strand:+ start:472 stop:1245 length:774 start_codon:yes stop_codon:yes gene_type:complete
MSKKIFAQLTEFLKTDKSNDELLDYIKEIINVNDPKPRTISARYSLIKKFLREQYPKYGEKFLKLVKPDDKLTDSIVHENDMIRKNKKNFVFNQNIVDKILNLKNSDNIYDKMIYLQFISGRRISEIFGEHDMKLSVVRNKPNYIKFSKLNKQKDDKPSMVKLMDTDSKSFKKMYLTNKKIIDGIALKDLNKRINNRLRKVLGIKEMSSHNLRGIYAVYLFHTDNPDNQNINGYLTDILNHDSTDASLNYSNYIFEK